MIRTVALAFFVSALASLAPAVTKGVCSTGHYNTCLTCCRDHPSITDRDSCSRQCTQISDSPLQQLLAKKKVEGVSR